MAGKQGNDKAASEEAAKPSNVTAEANATDDDTVGPTRTRGPSKAQVDANKAAAEDGIEAKMERLEFPDSDSEEARRKRLEEQAGISEPEGTKK